MTFIRRVYMYSKNVNANGFIQFNLHSLLLYFCYLVYSSWSAMPKTTNILI